MHSHTDFSQIMTMVFFFSLPVVAQREVNKSFSKSDPNFSDARGQK